MTWDSWQLLLATSSFWEALQFPLQQDPECHTPLPHPLLPPESFGLCPFLPITVREMTQDPQGWFIDISPIPDTFSNS